MPSWAGFPTLSRGLGARLLAEQSRLKAQYCGDVAHAATREVTAELTRLNTAASHASTDSDYGSRSGSGGGGTCGSGAGYVSLLRALRACLEVVTRNYQELVVSSIH